MGGTFKKLQKAAFPVKNEDGSVIIATFLVLVLLTVVGIASTNVSNNEMQVTGHTVKYHRNFYRAEGAAIQAVVKLEKADVKNDTINWLEATELESTEIRTKVMDKSYWDSGSGGVVPTNSDLDDTRYTGFYGGVYPGSTLAMNRSKIHGFGIYGYCAPPEGGEAVVLIGYRKAY